MKRLILLIIAISILISPVHAREILDMTGKEVTVQDKIDKVFSGSPPLTYMIYAIEPDLLSGLNSRLTGEEGQFLDKKIQELPVLGGFYGQGNIANLEMVLKTGPDLIILWADKDSGISKDIEEMMMKNLPIPAVHVVFEDINDYGDAFLFLGKLLGREERGKTLKKYADDILKTVDQTVTSIPIDEIPTVYYAEGTDGLNADCDGSWHAELINISGAKMSTTASPRM